MALSQNGIDYICQKFGDTNLCCMNSGLSWYYTVEGTNYPETGATAQVVSRLASGLITSLTMTTPARGTFTQTQLNNANGSTVTLQDAQAITLHDEPSEDQWCYSAPPICEDILTQAECIANNCFWYNGSCHSSITCDQIVDMTGCLVSNCYWYNGSCHSTAPTCSDISTEIECLNANCYWCDGQCQSTPCGIVCSDFTDQPTCEAANCFWYQKHFWEEPGCHSEEQNMLMDYLPYIIIAGAGGLALIIALSKRPAPQYPPPMYPPPYPRR